jgi:aromatic ring hydroxylase
MTATVQQYSQSSAMSTFVPKLKALLHFFFFIVCFLTNSHRLKLLKLAENFTASTVNLAQTLLQAKMTIYV